MKTIPSFLAVLVALGFAAPLAAQTAGWRSYGATPASTKFSPASQITAANAADVELAWTWHSPDDAVIAANPEIAAATLKGSPLMVGGVLFFRTNLSQVAALDAATGEQRWVFDPRSYETGRPPNFGFNTRGVVYGDHADGDGRIYVGTGDAHLWALDADTGAPDRSFGDNGRIDLTRNLRRDVERAEYSSLSPPIVVGNVLVVGSSISDGPTHRAAPPGDVRGFDARTGELLWTFHTIPQPGEVGHESWETGWEYTGATNAWTLLSADVERGIVYVPLGTPTNDWYGGHRLGDNLFAESLVALDAATGERLWHFQFVHHGVWDYDLPAAPNLVDLEMDGERVPAVAQITKQGFVFLFDRRTGEPLHPIEERPVPPSAIPGERLSPTQPFPVRPPPFDRQGIGPDDIIDFSPEIRAEAEAILATVDHGPLYTPPSERGTLNLPGWLGGGDWEGAAVDPERGILYVPSRTQPIRVQLVEPDPAASDFRYIRGGARSMAGPRGLPLTKPPYARMTAIDLQKGEILWQVPIGDGPRAELMEMGVPDPGPLGGGAYTGPVLTPELLFVGHSGARGGDPDAGGALLAIDPETGETVAEIDLPVDPTGTPITYMADGRQYLVVAFGSGGETGLVGLRLAE